jgi:acyl carrier protein
MISGSGESVKSLILARLGPSLVEMGLAAAALTDDFDLLTSGVIDSLGIVELLAALEQQLGMVIDLSELDPENLTILGPLSRYIENQYLQSSQVRRSLNRGPSVSGELPDEFARTRRTRD